MYSALDTACKVVNYANEKGWSMSNLKLQKVLYFIQGYYLQMVRKPFFEEEIEAWPYVHMTGKWCACSAPSVYL